MVFYSLYVYGCFRGFAALQDNVKILLIYFDSWILFCMFGVLNNYSMKLILMRQTAELLHTRKKAEEFFKRFPQWMDKGTHFICISE